MIETKKPRGHPRAVKPPVETSMPETTVEPLPAAKRPLALRVAGHFTQTYELWVPEGTVVEQVCEPSFWSNVAKKLRRADKIEVMPNDMAWRALLIVRGQSNIEAIVQVLAYDELGPASDTAMAGAPYEVKFINPERKFGVFRRGTGELLRDEFQTREHAERYLLNHTKLIAA